MFIDLSAVTDDGLALILLRVPVKDLIKTCPQVSRQWNRILSDNFFWQRKMEQDGYWLKWSKLAGLSTKLFKSIALTHCFERNFIKDNLHLEDQGLKFLGNLIFDPRWKANRIVWQGEDSGSFTRVEIPPIFADGEPEIPPGYDKPIEACLAIPYQRFAKEIVIELADEGLTDEIMDNYRPTIVVTEWIANRRDCSTLYAMSCSLEKSPFGQYPHGEFRCNFQNEDQLEYREESKHEIGQWIGATIAFRFKQGDAEAWHHVEHQFKDYPAGMRYLVLHCVGMGYGSRPNVNGKYGLKLANCSVKALCEKNAK